MDRVELNKDNLLEQITEFGFFSELIPPCFTSRNLANNLSRILPLVNTSRKQSTYSKKNQTKPSQLSIYKNDISRRILSVPNPESFLRVAKLYAENWEKIKLFAKSDNSLSPITYIYDYNGFQKETINNSKLIEKYKFKSYYINGIKECIRVALGYQYRLRVDIASCYNSIYTHSITWAICGKDNAKKYLRDKKPEDIKINYELGDNIDAFTRFQKSNETNGILVGPFTSRIFSEIVLSALDRELNKQGFIFKRYVDDYKFYFRTKSKAEESIKTIEKILNQYNFNLNISKTEICRFPYEVVSNILNEYKKALRSDGIFGVLNKASQLYLSGEKGAYKYALKFIKGKYLCENEFETVFPLLINIMILEPTCGNYVVEFLNDNILKIDMDKLGKVINNELFFSLSQNLQQESLMFLYIIYKFDLEISAENMKLALNSEDDFSLIIALDIWKNKNSLVTRSKSEAAYINKAIMDIAEDLRKETYKGSRWMILHEAKCHKLLPANIYETIEKSDFFDSLFSNNISFYISAK